MIYLYDETESTNDLALKAAGGEAPHGACWVADRQTKGRGRREIGGQRREWFSPAGTSIYMSVLLHPEVEAADATALTLAGAVGVADALVEATNLDIWLKWPNDLYIGDRKLGGMLTEASFEGGHLEAVVCGLGINVNVAEEEVPEELREIMTSLFIESGQRWDRMGLLFDIRDQLVARSDAYADAGIEAVLDDLRDYDRTEGRQVEISRDDGWVSGTSKGIDDRGQLLVEVDGEVVEMQAGEVRFPEL